MNKDYILENDVIGRYVAGALDDAEAEAFEVAYFNDGELAALVEAEQALQEQFSKAAKPADGVSWAGWSIAAAVALVSVPILYFATRDAVGPYALSSTAPEAPSAVYELAVDRGSIPSLAIPIPDQPDGRVILAVPVRSGSDEAVRLALRDNVSNIVWQETHVAAETLYLSVAATELVQGNYELRVESLDDGDSAIEVIYRFRTYITGLDPESQE